MAAGFTEKRARELGPYRRFVLIEVIEAMNVEKTLDAVHASHVAGVSLQGKKGGNAAGIAIGELQRFKNELMNAHEAARERAQNKIMQEAGENWGALKAAYGLPETAQTVPNAFAAARQRATPK